MLMSVYKISNCRLVMLFAFADVGWSTVNTFDLARELQPGPGPGTFLSSVATLISAGVTSPSTGGYGFCGESYTSKLCTKHLLRLGPT